MKHNTSDFMELLESFFSEYLPYSAGLSENTIKSYKYAFRLLFVFLYEEKKIPASNVTFTILNYDTVNSFLRWLEESRGCSVSTRNQRLAALSSFASYSQNRNFEAGSIFTNAVSKTIVKKITQPQRTVFSLDEVKIMLALPDASNRIGQRDQAILSLLYASGARAQEICDLCIKDFLFHDNTARLCITGKGNKTRRILLPKHCAEILKRYIYDRNLENKPDQHIFSSQTHEHMSVSCVEEIFKKYVNMAREKYPSMFTGKKYTPHTMRHTCATHMLEAGVPIMAIKNFLGHTSVTTTERYAELSQGTVNQKIREWNNRWFSDQSEYNTKHQANNIPEFLSVKTE